VCSAHVETEQSAETVENTEESTCTRRQKKHGSAESTSSVAAATAVALSSASSASSFKSSPTKDKDGEEGATPRKLTGGSGSGSHRHRLSNADRLHQLSMDESYPTSEEMSSATSSEMTDQSGRLVISVGVPVFTVLHLGVSLLSCTSHSHSHTLPITHPTSLSPPLSPSLYLSLS
jgi:hypothetical protein